MFQNLGLQNVANYSLGLRGELYKAMAILQDNLIATNPTKYAGLEIISPSQNSMVASPIVSLNIPEAVISNSDLCSRLLNDYGVVVKKLADYEGGNDFVVNAIRVTTHMFNNENDISKLMNGLTRILLGD